MGDTLGFNVSHFFNNTIDEVSKQIDFCGRMNYGKQFELLEGKIFAKTHYQNMYLSVWDTLMMAAVDCKHPPLNLTSHDSDLDETGFRAPIYNLFDQCKLYLEDNEINIQN